MAKVKRIHVYKYTATDTVEEELVRVLEVAMGAMEVTMMEQFATQCNDKRP